MLKSLADHNNEQDHLRALLDAPRANGIACPQCGAEMIDSSPGITLTSMPPQKHVHCPACGFRGYARE